MFKKLHLTPPPTLRFGLSSGPPPINLRTPPPPDNYYTVPNTKARFNNYLILNSNKATEKNFPWSILTFHLHLAVTRKSRIKCDVWPSWYYSNTRENNLQSWTKALGTVRTQLQFHAFHKFCRKKQCCLFTNPCPLPPPHPIQCWKIKGIVPWRFQHCLLGWGEWVGTYSASSARVQFRVC